MAGFPHMYLSQPLKNCWAGEKVVKAGHSRNLARPESGMLENGMNLYSEYSDIRKRGEDRKIRPAEEQRVGKRNYFGG